MHMLTCGHIKICVFFYVCVCVRASLHEAIAARQGGGYGGEKKVRLMLTSSLLPWKQVLRFFAFFSSFPSLSMSMPPPPHSTPIPTCRIPPPLPSTLHPNLLQSFNNVTGQNNQPPLPPSPSPPYTLVAHSSTVSGSKCSLLLISACESVR